MFRSGIRPRTTILVVVLQARTPRTSIAPFTNKGKKASTRTTFLLRADVAKCLTLLVIVSCCCGRCSFVRAWTNPTNKERMPLGASENDSSRMKGNSHVQFVFFLGGEGQGSPPLTWPGPKFKWSGGPTHPNQGYAGIREEQHLTMFMTNRILTYQ